MQHRCFHRPNSSNANNVTRKLAQSKTCPGQAFASSISSRNSKAKCVGKSPEATTPYLSRRFKWVLVRSRASPCPPCASGCGRFPCPAVKNNTLMPKESLCLSSTIQQSRQTSPHHAWTLLSRTSLQLAGCREKPPVKGLSENSLNESVGLLVQLFIWIALKDP